MIFEQIQLEMDCYSKTKELATGSEYSSVEDLITDVATDVSTSEQIASRYVNNVIPPFDVGYCYFDGDTSLLYAFNKNDLNIMIVQNPGLSSYVVDNSINIRVKNPFLPGSLFQEALTSRQLQVPWLFQSLGRYHPVV